MSFLLLSIRCTTMHCDLHLQLPSFRITAMRVKTESITLCWIKAISVERGCMVSKCPSIMIALTELQRKVMLHTLKSTISSECLP